ncbi:MAG: FixH family protein [Anaerolineales bacterium]|nr:FixH family protein [Anaerolineales bacterium]
MTNKLILALMALLLTSCGMMPAPSVEQPTPIPTFTPAASSVQDPAANQIPALGGKQSGDLLVWIFSDPNPPSRGETTLEVLIADLDGKPISDAAISFDIDMTNMSHGRNVTTASLLGDGRYSAEVHFLMPGPWRVIVGIERAGETSTVRFDFMVAW